MASKLSSPVILGYAEPVGKKYRKETLSDACISRIGGPPALLKSAPALTAEETTCGKCTKPMRLLLQLFAPESDDRPHAYMRLIYVLTCDDGKCAEDGFSKSFKVLRSQSTAVDLQDPIDWSASEFPLLEVMSEAEPTEPVKEKKVKDVSGVTISEVDPSEKYTKVKGDNAFYKFNKRLSIAPEQVLRYVRTKDVLSSSSEATLWISDKGKLMDKDIPKCEHCKVARSLEFQIMPTLLSYLDIDDTKAETLDWGVLCVYTCNEACKAANEQFVQEKLFRQQYDMKTSIF